jgi:hypothetical protein
MAERTARIERKEDVKHAMVEAVNGTISQAMADSSVEQQKIAKAVVAEAVPVAKQIVVEAARVAAEKLNEQNK